MEKTILNFHFDYLIICLKGRVFQNTQTHWMWFDHNTNALTRKISLERESASQFTSSSFEAQLLLQLLIKICKIKTSNIKGTMKCSNSHFGHIGLETKQYKSYYTSLWRNWAYKQNLLVWCTNSPFKLSTCSVHLLRHLVQRISLGEVELDWIVSILFLKVYWIGGQLCLGEVKLDACSWCVLRDNFLPVQLRRGGK